MEKIKDQTKEKFDNKEMLDDSEAFEADVKRTPLYDLKKQIKQAQRKLEELKDSPDTSHNEIAELDRKLMGWKREYAERVKSLKTKINEKVQRREPKSRG